MGGPSVGVSEGMGVSVGSGVGVAVGAGVRVGGAVRVGAMVRVGEGVGAMSVACTTRRGVCVAVGEAVGTAQAEANHARLMRQIKGIKGFIAGCPSGCGWSFAGYHFIQGDTSST